MKRDRKQRCLLAVGIIAVAVTEFLPNAPKARAQEPVEECQTHWKWAAKAGNQAAVAQVACPTRGTCDTPSERDSWIPGPSTPTVHLRIRLHIFCDGTNCAATQSGVSDAISKLNSDYAPHRFQFTASAEEINSSTYRNFLDSEEVAMKNTYADDPGHQINVYVVNILGGYLGVGTFPWDPDSLENMGGIIVDDGAFGAGKSTLTHEVGHCLGLWHTHHGVSEVSQCSACYERADGVDGDITGDFSAETPPTPRHSSSTCAEINSSIIDPCSVPPRSWVPTQYQNFMGYATQECRTLFTPQQAGRMHCWFRDKLTGWRECITAEDCPPLGCNAVPLCISGKCEYQLIAFEYPNYSCRDGLDNDCDGYPDCEDVADCVSDPGCRCDDNGGNSPLVCVDWGATFPPEPDINFRVEFADSANPDVTFLTGNDDWKVWSQAGRTDNTPANLRHVRIDPTLPAANFSVTIAHGPLPGAANVASMALVKENWTGQSNISGGRISGDLAGNLVLQESAGQGGEAFFAIAGDVNGDITIPKVGALQVIGAVSSETMMVLGMVPGSGLEFNTGTGNFAGDLSLPDGIPPFAIARIEGSLSDTGSVVFNGQELGGSLSLSGGTSEQSVINVGAVTGRMWLSGSAYSGTATFTAIEPSGEMTIVAADLDGSLNVLEDWKGSLSFVYGSFAPQAAISIGGNLADTGRLSFFEREPGLGAFSGDLLIAQNCQGSIELYDDMAGDILVGGMITGNVTVYGEFNGNICASNLSATSPLPANIDIAQFGPNGKVCGQLVCGGALSAETGGIKRNRDTPFTGPATSSILTALEVRLIDLYHPVPANPPGRPQPNFSTFDTTLNNVCTGPGPLSGYYCQTGADCTGSGTCPPGVGCTAAGETNGCARWVGPPFTYLESRDSPGIGNYKAARLQCTPYYRDWGGQAVVHVVGSEILPSSTYEIRMVPQVGSYCASPLPVTTSRGGDVFAPFNPPDSSPQPEGPDVAAMVNKFKNLPGAIAKSIAQVNSNAPILNNDVDGSDISVVVDAVKGFAYGFSGPCPCPSSVPCDTTVCLGNGQCVGAPGNYGAGAACVRTCRTGPRVGQPCGITLSPLLEGLDCGSCVGGPRRESVLDRFGEKELDSHPPKARLACYIEGADAPPAVSPSVLTPLARGMRGAFAA